jgi:hypothetical protein
MRRARQRAAFRTQTRHVDRLGHGMTVRTDEGALRGRVREIRVYTRRRYGRPALPQDLHAGCLRGRKKDCVSRFWRHLAVLHGSSAFAALPLRCNRN